MATVGELTQLRYESVVAIRVRDYAKGMGILTGLIQGTTTGSMRPIGIIYEGVAAHTQPTVVEGVLDAKVLNEDGDVAALHVAFDGSRHVCILTAGDRRHDVLGQVRGACEIAIDPHGTHVYVIEPETTVAGTMPFKNIRSFAPATDARIRVWSVLKTEANDSLSTEQYDHIPNLLPDWCYTGGPLSVTASGDCCFDVSRDDHMGRRYFAICIFSPRLNRFTLLSHPMYDLTGLVSNGSTGEAALRASTRYHTDETTLKHELWHLSCEPYSIEQAAVIDDGEEVWREAVGWSSEGLAAIYERRGRRSVSVLKDRGWVDVTLQGSTSLSIESFVVDGGSALAIASSLTQLPQPWFWQDVMTVGVPLEDLVPIMAGGVIERVECAVTARGRRHATGYCLILPEGAPRSVIALFHGGPTMSWSRWSWRWNPQPYLEEGHAVLYVDPAGSDGYGAASHAVAWRGWRPGIAASAVATVKLAVEAQGLEDLPLATIGGSFGGYLAVSAGMELGAAVVAAHATPMAPAVVASRSSASWSWTREWGPLHEACGLEDESLDPQSVDQTAVFLISHGLDDMIVPHQESVSLARMLQIQGVSCQLALLAGEAHAIGSWATIEAWYRWVLVALDRALARREDYL